MEMKPSHLPSFERNALTVHGLLGKGGFSNVYSVAPAEEENHWRGHVPKSLSFDSESPSTDVTEVSTGGDCDTEDSPSARHEPLRKSEHRVDYAMKTLNSKTLKDSAKAMRAAKDMQKEYSILANLPYHPNIIQLRGVSANFFDENPAPENIFLLLEKVDESLDQLITRWVEDEKQRVGCIGAPRVLRSKQRMELKQAERFQTIALGLVEAMSFLHEHNVIYRDLKPANCGVHSDGRVILFDFASAVKMEPNSPLRSRTGTLRYLAPECALRKEYDLKVDVYSFGIVLWELCTLEKPYKKIKSPDSLKMAVMRSDVHPPLDKSHIPSSKIRHLLGDCWASDPIHRPTFPQIRSLLKEEIQRMIGTRLEIVAVTKQMKDPPSL